MESHDKVNILLVDDQPGKLLTYKAMLAELGENLVEAQSARDALDLLLRMDVAVILVDVCMPDLDGFELSAMIRQHPRFQKTAIILVSAVLMSDLDRMRGYTSGAMDYVPVPVVPEILRAKVSVFVELYRNNLRLRQLTEQLEHRVAERTRELEATNALVKRNEAQLRHLTNAVPSILWSAEPDGTIVYASASWYEYTGLSPHDDARSRPSVVHPDDQDRCSKAWDDAIENETDYRVEVRYRRHDGQYHWFLTLATPSHDEEGKLVGWFGSTTDINDHKLAEQALRDSEARTRLIIDTALDAVITMDDSGRIVGWNKQAELIFGWPAHEVFGKSLSSMVMPERFRDEHSAGLSHFLSTGQGPILNQRVELWALRRDGTEFPIELTVTCSPSGGSFVFNGFIRDISERREVERERKRSAQRMAAEFAVTRILSESESLREAIPPILQALGESLHFDFGAFWEMSSDETYVRCQDLWPLNAHQFEAFARATQEMAFKKGEGLPGRVWEKMDAARIENLETDTNFPRQSAAIASGLFSGVAFPIRLGREFIGVLEFYRCEKSVPDSDMMAMMNAVGSEIGQFIKRKRAEAARVEAIFREQAAAQEVFAKDQRYRFLEEAIPEVLRNRGSREALRLETKVQQKYGKRPLLTRAADISQRYVIAFLFVALSTAVKLAFSSIGDERAPFLLTTGAVLGATWYGGLVPGLLATVLTAISVNWFFTDPVGGLGQFSPLHVIHLSLFIVEGLFICIATAYLKLARDDRTRLLVREQAARSESQTGERRYRSLVDASAAMVWTTNETGLFVVPQSAWEVFTGQSWEKQTGWGWLEAIHPDDRPLLQNVWAGKERHESDMRIWHERSRGYRFCHIRAVPVSNSDGTVREWIGSCQDVTEQRAAQQALLESEQRFRTMADSAPVLIWTTDRQGRYDYFNRRWLDFTGRPVDDELGDGWMSGVHPDDMVQVRTLVESATRNQQEYKQEYRLRRADGEFRWILENAVPRFTQSGDFIGFIGSCKDITERRQAEEVLRQHRARLEAMVEERTQTLRQTQEQLLRSERLASIGILAAGIAHEINNPLNTILLTAEYAIRGNHVSNEQIRESLQTIRHEAERGGRVVKGVLKFAREEKTIKSPGNINQVVLAAADLIGTYVRAAHLSVNLELAESPLLVMMNATEIEQVLINLVKNAADATEAEVNVIIRTRSVGDWVEIDVADDGPGIPDSILARVFDPFFSTRQGRGGTGLGLSICHGIVTDHGGVISAASQVGKGTTMVIRLPVCVTAETAHG